MPLGPATCFSGLPVFLVHLTLCGPFFFLPGTLHAHFCHRAFALLFPHPRQLFAQLASPCHSLSREAYLHFYGAPPLPALVTLVPITLFHFLSFFFSFKNFCFSLGPAFKIYIHTENQDQAIFFPSASWVLFHFLHSMHLTLNFSDVHLFICLFSVSFVSPWDRSIPSEGLGVQHSQVLVGEQLYLRVSHSHSLDICLHTAISQGM